MGKNTDFTGIALLFGLGYLAYKIEAFKMPDLGGFLNALLKPGAAAPPRDVTMMAGRDIPRITFQTLYPPSVPASVFKPALESTTTTSRNLAKLLGSATKALESPRPPFPARLRVISEKLAWEARKQGLEDF